MLKENMSEPTFPLRFFFSGFFLYFWEESDKKPESSWWAVIAEGHMGSQKS